MVHATSSLVISLTERRAGELINHDAKLISTELRRLDCGWAPLDITKRIGRAEADISHLRMVSNPWAPAYSNSKLELAATHRTSVYAQSNSAFHSSCSWKNQPQYPASLQRTLPPPPPGRQAPTVGLFENTEKRLLLHARHLWRLSASSPALSDTGVKYLIWNFRVVETRVEFFAFLIIAFYDSTSSERTLTVVRYPN